MDCRTKLPPIRAESSLVVISLDHDSSQSKALGPKRLQTHPTSNLQTPSFLPQTPASSTLFPPGQCSSSVPPPPSPGARLPALSLSLSAPSLLPSSAVRDSYGLIRASHDLLVQPAWIASMKSNSLDIYGPLHKQQANAIII